MADSGRITKLSIRQLIWICVGIITGVFVISMSIFLAARFTVAHAVGDLSSKALPAQDDVAALSRAYVDQETGQRGFLLTAGNSFLDPYHEGQVEADRLVAALRVNLADDAQGTQLLTAVVAAGEEW